MKVEKEGETEKSEEKRSKWKDRGKIKGKLEKNGKRKVYHREKMGAEKKGKEGIRERIVNQYRWLYQLYVGEAQVEASFYLGMNSKIPITTIACDLGIWLWGNVQPCFATDVSRRDC